MGKLQMSLLDHLEAEHYRVMTAIELGHRNHQLVPMQIIAVVAKLQRGGCKKYVDDLVRYKVVAFAKLQNVCGYRLTMQGYDILAINTLMRRDAVKSIGRTIGCGKESYVYEAIDNDDQVVVVKIHRLGQTCFRSLKRNRDYLSKRHAASWIYMSRLSALKEFEHQKILHANGFPVPAVIAHNRNAIVMQKMDGVLMNDIVDLGETEVEILAQQLLGLIQRFAENGLLHCDFNEFNIIIDENLNPCVIDFPQMVSVHHPNASLYFDRDVKSICDFFRRRSKFIIADDMVPQLKDIRCTSQLDKQLKISGCKEEFSTKDYAMLCKPLSSDDDSSDDGQSTDSGDESGDGNSNDGNSTEADEVETASLSADDAQLSDKTKSSIKKNSRWRNWTVGMAQKKLVHERRVTNRRRVKNTLSSVNRDCFRAEHRGKQSRYIRAEIAAELNER